MKAVKLDFGKTTTEKIGFYFLTYELNQRRIPLVKMVNGVEEVLILLFVAFEYEYLVNCGVLVSLQRQKFFF